MASGPSEPGPAETGLDELRAELRGLHEQGIRVLERLQDQGRVRRDQPARHLLVALLGLVRNWFEERNLVADESDPQRVADTDAAYVRTLWVVIGEGLLVPPRGARPGESHEIASPTA